MSEIVASLTSAFTLAFVITSMFGLGLGLTVRDIVAPLKNVRLVLLALVANFLIVPAAAWAIADLLSLEPDLRIALILFSAVAGAPSRSRPPSSPAETCTSPSASSRCRWWRLWFSSHSLCPS